MSNSKADDLATRGALRSSLSWAFRQKKGLHRSLFVTVSCANFRRMFSRTFTLSKQSQTGIPESKGAISKTRANRPAQICASYPELFRKQLETQPKVFYKIEGRFISVELDGCRNVG